MTPLYILWDESHIWGVLVARAARAMGIPYALVRSGDVASGLLRKRPPSLFVVPGGSARHKAETLGVEGMEAVRSYVDQGGHYMGFCGGAGLALSAANGADALGLCPWQRGRFDDRLQHFMSGHMFVNLAEPLVSQDVTSSVSPKADTMAEAPVLPVWWPGRFASTDCPKVTVLASYARPAQDFWLADLPIADFPPDIFDTWQDLYGLSVSPTFLEGQPCVVHGTYGKGSYILSYSHLETPDSPFANRWLAHILRTLCGFELDGDPLPPWDVQTTPAVWEDPELAVMDQAFNCVLQTGLKHGLLFERTRWLFGWRAGIPGANLNNLWTALSAIREREPDDATLRFWKAHKSRIAEAAVLFCQGVEQYLLSERLALTLLKTLPDTLPQGLLKDRREALFGPPMHAGGLYRELIEVLDELAFLQLQAKPFS